MSNKKSQRQFLNSSMSKLKVHSVSLKECRICMQNQEESNDEMRAPCKCEGTVKYVHVSCLKRWIIEILKAKRKTEISSFVDEGLPCQLCKTRIYFDVESESTCGSFAENTQKISKKKIIFIILTVLLACVFGVIGYCVNEMIKGLNQSGTDSIRFAIFLSIIGVLCLLIGLIIFFYAAQFCVVIKVTIPQIQKQINGKKIRLSQLTDNYTQTIKIEEIQ